MFSTDRHTHLLSIPRIVAGLRGAATYIRRLLGETQCRPWKGRQSITGEHTETHSEKKQQEHKNRRIKPEQPERTHTCIRRTFKPHAEKTQDQIQWIQIQDCRAVRVQLFRDITFFFINVTFMPAGTLCQPLIKTADDKYEPLWEKERGAIRYGIPNCTINWFF